MTTIKGKVHKIMAEQFVSEKFSKRELIIKTDDKFPQFIPVTFSNSKMVIVDGLNEGDEVEVSYNIRGREWNDKYFVSLEGWNLQVLTDKPKQNEKQESGLPF